MSSLLGIRRRLPQHLLSPSARSALAGSARRESGKDTPLSLPEPVVPAPDLRGKSAGSRASTGTRDGWSHPDPSAGRLPFGRPAGIASPESPGNESQSGHRSPSGQEALGA